MLLTFVIIKSYRVNENHRPHNNYSEFIPIKFVSKELEDLNSVFNSNKAMENFPTKRLSKKFSNVDFRFSACYKYEKSIRHDIINYKNNIMDEELVTDIKCFCHLYPEFIDRSVGHVVTRDVNVQ